MVCEGYGGQVQISTLKPQHFLSVRVSQNRKKLYFRPSFYHVTRWMSCDMHVIQVENIEIFIEYNPREQRQLKYFQNPKVKTPVITRVVLGPTLNIQLEKRSNDSSPQDLVFWYLSKTFHVIWDKFHTILRVRENLDTANKS